LRLLFGNPFSNSIVWLCCCTGNYACRGGWMNNAYSYVRAAGGIDKESCYPYRATVCWTYTLFT